MINGGKFDLSSAIQDSEVSQKLKEQTGDAIAYGLDWYVYPWFSLHTFQILVSISENGTIQQAQRSFGSSGGHLVCIRFITGEPARDDVKTESTIIYTALGKDAIGVWPNTTMRTSNEDRALYAKWATLATHLFGEGKLKV